MPAHRLLALALSAALLALLLHQPSAGQAPKAGPKVKPGAPLVAEPNDLPKAGGPLSPWALVQRPPALKNVRAWSVETKRHRWTVSYLAARPDGKKVATSGGDGIVRVWDADTGELDRALLGHEGHVGGVAWSPDGKYLASAGYYSVRVWDGATGLPVRVLKGKYGVNLVAWSPDGTRLLTGGGGSGGIAVWDVAANKQLAETEYGTQIYGIAFSPSGEQVATAASRSGTYISDAARLKTIHTIRDAATIDTAVAFSPDGKLLAAGNAKQVVVYDTNSGALTRKLEMPGVALAWTPAGGLLVAGSTSQVTPHAPPELTPGKPLPGTASALSLTADGMHLFGLSGGQVTRWDLEKATVVRSIPIAEYTAVACGPSPVVLVQSATPTLWDVPTGKKIGVLEGHAGKVGALGWAPNGKFLATAAGDKKVRVYEPATAKLVRTLTAPAAVSALALTNEGKVAAATADKKVVVWPAAGDVPLATFDGHKRPPRALAWNRDGRTLASGDGKDIFIYATDTGKQTKSLDHPRDVHSLAWSADGRLVVGASEDVALAAYQVSSWKIQPALEKGTNALAIVTACWSPDGQTLLGHRNSAIQQWNGKTGKLGPACGTPVGAYTLAYSPDGRTVQAGCADRVARYWDAATARLRMTAVADRAELVAVSADGHYRVPEAAEPEMIAVVMTDKAYETVPLKELTAKYGFKNVAGNVK